MAQPPRGWQLPGWEAQFGFSHGLRDLRDLHAGLLQLHMPNVGFNQPSMATPTAPGSHFLRSDTETKWLVEQKVAWATTHLSQTTFLAANNKLAKLPAYVSLLCIFPGCQEPIWKGSRLADAVQQLCKASLGFALANAAAHLLFPGVELSWTL